MTRPEPLPLDPLAPYEDRLLATLAFFRFQRNVASQARHCLSMYLRQGEGRIMQEVRFYARQLGMDADELIELIYHDSDRAAQLMEQVFADGGGLMDADD
jgi:hypothetical protein